MRRLPVHPSSRRRALALPVAALLACNGPGTETDGPDSETTPATGTATDPGTATATTVSTGPTTETTGPTDPGTTTAGTDPTTQTTSPTDPTTSTSDPTVDPTGTTTGQGVLDCTKAWESGFESGFPGEWLNYDNGSWSEDGTMPPGRVSAWTIVDASDGEPAPIFGGDHIYKGWIEDAAPESHRAYPGIHTNTPTPLVNTFMVYLDADYDVMGPSEWIHFGTWGNDDGMGNGKWALHTMSVRDRKLEFAHTEPFSGEYIGPEPQPDFPRDQWVRLTAYIHYEGNTGFVQVWQDGVPMLRATVSQLQDNPGTDLLTAHWGMYASAETSQGVQYNDDIEIWTLPAPLDEQDLETEPDCYLGD